LFYFNLVFLLSFFLEILKSCNHVLLKSCFQSFFPDWNISFNLAFNIEIRCKKREKKRPLKTLSRFVLRCPVLSTNHLFYSIINQPETPFRGSGASSVLPGDVRLSV